MLDGSVASPDDCGNPPASVVPTTHNARIRVQLHPGPYGAPECAGARHRRRRPDAWRLNGLGRTLRHLIDIWPTSSSAASPGQLATRRSTPSSPGGADVHVFASLAQLTPQRYRPDPRYVRVYLYVVRRVGSVSSAHSPRHWSSRTSRWPSGARSGASTTHPSVNPPDSRSSIQIYGFPAIDGPDGGTKVAFFRRGQRCTPDTSAPLLDRAARWVGIQ